MKKTNETVDDVIEYIRGLYCYYTIYVSKTGLPGDDFDEIADRLEAALTRERTAKKSK